MAGRSGIGIVALAPNDWYGQWVNRQQLLSRLGTRWPIMYSTGAWTIWDRGSKEWTRSGFAGTFSRSNNVWVDLPPRWLMRWPRFGAWDRAAMRIEARRLRRRLAQVGARTRIAYLFHPLFLPYLKYLDATRVVYHAYDLYDHQPGWNAALEAAERYLLERADLVIVPSEALAEELRKKAARPIRVILNAANVQVFVAAARREGPEPDDLARIPHPRIGYVGSLHPQLDYSLVRALAERRPGYHWVMVGPKLREKDLVIDPDFQAFTRLPNVHLLGAKSNDGVAAYTACMDVNVMIYRSTESSWTKVAYPLKLHEYLAAGRPIVTMELPMLLPLAHVIRFARDVDDWTTALDDAILVGGVGTPDMRQRAAAGHTWDARSGVLDAWLRELVGDANAGAMNLEPVQEPGMN